MKRDKERKTLLQQLLRKKSRATTATTNICIKNNVTGKHTVIVQDFLEAAAAQDSVFVNTCVNTCVNTFMYTCLCECACVRNVSPCKWVAEDLKQTWRRPGLQTSSGPPEHESFSRTTAGTTAAPTQRRAEERPSIHVAEAPDGFSGALEASYPGADRALGPETRDPRAPQPLAEAQPLAPSRGSLPRPTKWPLGVSQYTPEHPAPDPEKY